MKIKQIFIILILFNFIVSCSSSRFTVNKKDCNIELTQEEDPDLLYADILREQEVPSFADKTLASRGSLIGQAFSVALHTTNAIIANEQRKYTSQYKKNIDYLYFYDCISEKGHFDPTGMQFSGLEVLNSFKKGENTDTAFYFKFEVDKSQLYEILNNSVFTMFLSDAKIDLSTAKLQRTLWYNPFTWGQKMQDEMLNMDIELIIKTSFITPNESIVKDLEVGRFFLPIRNIPMNPKHPEYISSREKLKNRQLEGYSFIIPRSKGYRIGSEMNLKEIFSQGRFCIDVSIKETSKDKLILKAFYDNKDMILKDTENSIFKIFD